MIAFQKHYWKDGNIFCEEITFQTANEALLAFDEDAAILWDRDVAPTFEYTEFTFVISAHSPNQVEVIPYRHELGTPFWRFYPKEETKDGHFFGWILVNGPEWHAFLEKEYGEPKSGLPTKEMQERIKKVQNGEPDLSFASDFKYEEIV